MNRWPKSSLGITMFCCRQILERLKIRYRSVYEVKLSSSSGDMLCTHYHRCETIRQDHPRLHRDGDSRLRHPHRDLLNLLANGEARHPATYNIHTYIHTNIHPYTHHIHQTWWRMGCCTCRWDAIIGRSCGLVSECTKTCMQDT